MCVAVFLLFVSDIDARLADMDVCRFFVQGTCRDGSRCKFKHDDSLRNVCVFHLQGKCTYGSSCRFDHVRPNAKPSAPTRTGAVPAAAAAATPSSSSSSAAAAAATAARMAMTSALSATQPQFVPLHKSKATALPKIQADWAACPEFVPAAARSLRDGRLYSALMHGAADDGLSADQAELQQYDQTLLHAEELAELEGVAGQLCPYTIARGECPFEQCDYVHGEPCPCCTRKVLFPDSLHEAENTEHVEKCMQALEQQLEVEELFEQSKQIACGICMDLVLEKSSLSECRFGLLQNCMHPFCLSCIREWRRKHGEGMSTTRACPLCRETSHFVIPSILWYKDEQQKQRVIEQYKENMQHKDCKHYDFGKGSCPFGSSCFYRHADKSGKVDQSKPRYVSGADGLAQPLAQIRLCEFFSQREQRVQ
eukprot:m.75012 g.75012  ORF g.75012 m.75012 type:complete len:424 (-) comp17137_c0_seq1:88-1359(-)